MNSLIDKILRSIKKNWQLYEEVTRETAVESIEFELGEMENIFSLLVLGSFIGLPAPPMQISLDLLPEMEAHLDIMLNKVDMANEPISNLFSVFEVI